MKPGKYWTLAGVLTLIVVLGLYLEAKVMLPDQWTEGGKLSPSLSRQAEDFSTKVIPAKAEAKLSTALTVAVPELEDVYYQMMSDGGVMVVGTASLDRFGNRYGLAADVTTRFLQTVYLDSEVPVDFAAIYTTYQGRYVLAAGLGRTVADELALPTLGADQEQTLIAELAHLNQYQGTPTTQAFAEYR